MSEPDFKCTQLGAAVTGQLILDPTSKLAAAIDRLAAALEKYNSRNAPLLYPFPDERPIWPPK